MNESLSPKSNERVEISPAKSCVSENDFQQISLEDPVYKKGKIKYIRQVSYLKSFC